MADTIRQALERLLAVIKPKYTDPDEIVAVVRAMAAARAALAAEPPAPDPRGGLAARPLLEAVARLGDCIGQHTVGEIATISDRAAAWLAENPPGQPVAIEPRGCPTPGACSCVEAPAPAPADHVPDAGNVVAADGEREELARWLDWLLPAFHREHDSTHASNCLRAAALLREACPQPVPVAERPWERPGWCDAEGRCWWGRCADGFFNPEWAFATHADIEQFCFDAMPQHCLPHWAIPQPPQGGEVEQ